MYSDHLLSKQGPLAHVWLAANYDKKLSKQQLLNTNIIKSSNIISTHPISYQSSQASGGDSNSDGKTITLRLSGQLLLGIVRIYSRKTKYLLDDANDILYKLKNSFKYANGGVVIGLDVAKSLVNLAPQQTIVSNVASITLTDQVADFDLLYQDDLNLDDVQGDANANTLFSQASGVNSLHDTSFNYDQSIEMARMNDTTMNNTNNDDDLELDFELGNEMDDTFDQSIEVGRNASQGPENNADISILSDINKENTTLPQDGTDFEFDFDVPLETIDETNAHEGANAENNDTPDINEPITPPPSSRPRAKLVGITEEGQLRTTKRKLMIDSAEDLETGISIQSLRDNQQLQLSDELPNEYLTLNLSETEKLQLIHELSYPFTSANKKRKLWNIDDQLQQRCLELYHEELQNNENNQDEAIPNDEFDDNLDFDISLPGLESEADISINVNDTGLNEEQDEDEEEFSNEVVTKSTVQIATQLREVFSKTERSVTDLTEMVENDLSIHNREESMLPLGITNRTQDTIKINKRREATKCFFELLVLATNDCITLDQEHNANKKDIGGTINIKPRDRIFNQFL